VLTFVTGLFCTALADDYLIKPGDTIGVTVLGEAELTRKIVVDPEGNISLPLAGSIAVSGLNPKEAAQLVAKKLRSYFKNPQVSVELVEMAKIPVTVSGEVKAPGIYPVVNGARVIDAITAAGGTTLKADLSKVTITHTGSSESMVVDFNRFMHSADMTSNPVLKSGDAVVVASLEKTSLGMISVIGAVRTPGQYPISRGVTAREAVMMAGGPTELADVRNVQLRRESASQPMPVDITGSGPDNLSLNPIVNPGDVVFVGVLRAVGYFSIQGGVAKPGKYEITGQSITLTEAIAMAGGTAGKPDLTNVSILRPSEKGNQTVAVNADSILSGKAQDVAVKDGDSIYVPPGKEKPRLIEVLSVAISLGWLLFSK
jgi:polysaccharide export outer membrane protein